MRVAALCSSFTIQCSSTNFQEKVPHIARQGMRNGSCLYILRSVYGTACANVARAAGAWKQPREGNINCGLPESMWSPGVNRLWLYWVESHWMACVSISHKDIMSISHHSFAVKQWSYSNTFLPLRYLKIGFDIAPMALISFAGKILDCWLFLYRGGVNASNSVNYENQTDKTAQ